MKYLLKALFSCEVTLLSSIMTCTTKRILQIMQSKIIRIDYLFPALDVENMRMPLRWIMAVRDWFVFFYQGCDPHLASKIDCQPFYMVILQHRNNKNCNTDLSSFARIWNNRVLMGHNGTHLNNVNEQKLFLQIYKQFHYFH